MDTVPATKSNYMLLMLLYWHVFDGIDIPKDIVNQMLTNATEPETISRAKRKVVENGITADKLREMVKEVTTDGEGTDKG